jgi:hypothetical protein
VQVGRGDLRPGVTESVRDKLDVPGRIERSCDKEFRRVREKLGLPTDSVLYLSRHSFATSPDRVVAR